MRRILGKGLLAAVAVVVAAEIVLQVAAPVVRYRYGRAAVVPRPDAVRILCVGDSNTYGLYVPRESSWPSQLQALLDRDAPGRYQVINLGFPGTPTWRIVENLPAFLARFHPDRVLVLAGVNDFVYGAIDAAGSRPGWRERVRAFATTHVRLYRAWLLWRRARDAPPVVHNEMDTLSSTLLSMPTLDDAGAARTLAGLYRGRGFAVREADGDFWLEHAGQSVHLNETLDAFRSPDLYALTQAFVRLPTQAGFDLRDVQLHLRMQIDGQSFEMEPHRGSAGVDEAILGRNLRLIGFQAGAAGADVLLLTYASHRHFYGQVNVALRRIAAEYGLPLLDVEPTITAQCPDDDCTAFFFPDYHPNAEGYRRMATLIAGHTVGDGTGRAATRAP